MKSTVRLLEERSTGHTVYAVAYSTDGQRLAYGEGFWYGVGRITCLDPAGNVAASVDCHEILGGDSNIREIAVSGLCFDRTDRFLAVSAWLWSHRYCPALVLRIEEPRLLPYLSTLDPPRVLKQIDIGNRQFATGVRLARGRMCVRRQSLNAEDLLSAFPLPPEIETEGLAHHLTSSRMAWLGDAVATGWEDSLVVASVEDSTKVVVAKSPRGREITAIASDPAGCRIITADSDGAAVFWERPNPLQPPQPVGVTPPGTGGPVMAACFLSDGERFATAQREGMVRVWREKTPLFSWSLPTGSPRSMAAHPTRPVLAVGCKHLPSESDWGGRVFQYEIMG